MREMASGLEEGQTVSPHQVMKLIYRDRPPA